VILLFGRGGEKEEEEEERRRKGDSIKTARRIFVRIRKDSLQDSLKPNTWW